MIGCIVQARMNSTRLYGKVLKKIDKNPVLYYVLKQINESKLIKKVVVATSELEIDDAIEKYAKKMNVEVFRGSPTDVLDRHYQCAKKYSFDPIVRVTADNPLNDPQIIDKAIEKMKSGKFDCITTSLLQTFPKGIHVDVISMDILRKAWKNSSIPYEREYVTPYIFNNSKKFKIYNLVNPVNLSHINFTIDKNSDLKFVRNIALKIQKRPILLKDILKLIDKEPELLEINKNHSFKRSYLKIRK
ncbi:cytidylyltransferase domain-containing protein [Candidatus Nitrosarchaeum limnium]|uniref:Cytidylyltransferase n=1 Tax=Candidatus Nitrosarchaeum limnium BG20 TaxID=859192 RepID=S2EL58_9ARCH|nr:glycosyltransferase family protein [Candidatus Nitrosarchaeum limnium]EPA05352.1 cytidylyltransferase [Candidatus Nitrosarchaeum limnium BG20]